MQPTVLQQEPSNILSQPSHLPTDLPPRPPPPEPSPHRARTPLRGGRGAGGRRWDDWGSKPIKWSTGSDAREKDGKREGRERWGGGAIVSVAPRGGQEVNQPRWRTYQIRERACGAGNVLCRRRRGRDVSIVPETARRPATARATRRRRHVQAERRRWRPSANPQKRAQVHHAAQVCSLSRGAGQKGVPVRLARPFARPATGAVLTHGGGGATRVWTHPV